MNEQHIFHPAPNFSAAQSMANSMTERGYRLADWQAMPNGTVVLHLVRPATPAEPQTKTRKK